MTRTKITDFYGRTIGFIEEDENGNKIIRDFYNRLKGRYDKASNTTRDFYNRIVGKGDLSSALLYK